VENSLASLKRTTSAMNRKHCY